MPAVHARSLTKIYRGRVAVDALDLDVADGGRVALLGPNGAGKTTTLMMLLGLTAPDSGEVSLLGHPIPKGRLDALRSTAFAASYLGWPWDLRVREFLELFADVYGCPAGRVVETAERLGIADLLGRRGKQLSSGQRTLTGLAKCLLARPRLIVLDEPTASLDPHTAWRVRALMRDVLDESGASLLLTSHNMADVEALCERVVFLSRGRVIADDTPDAIARNRSAAGLEEAFRMMASDEAP